MIQVKPFFMPEIAGNVREAGALGARGGPQSLAPILFNITSSDALMLQVKMVLRSKFHRRKYSSSHA
jgi:hypothetical protein